MGRRLLVIVGVVIALYLVINTSLRLIWPGGYCPHMPPEWAMNMGCFTFKTNANEFTLPSYLK
jgi:hypothetical protein